MPIISGRGTLELELGLEALASGAQEPSFLVLETKTIALPDMGPSILHVKACTMRKPQGMLSRNISVQSKLRSQNAGPKRNPAKRPVNAEVFSSAPILWKVQVQVSFQRHLELNGFSAWSSPSWKLKRFSRAAGPARIAHASSRSSFAGKSQQPAWQQHFFRRAVLGVPARKSQVSSEASFPEDRNHCPQASPWMPNARAGNYKALQHPSARAALHAGSLGGCNASACRFPGTVVY